MKQRLLNTMVNMSRWLLSTIFIFSGFVKLLDPTGTAMKIQEYLIALQLPVFPMEYALLCSVALSVLECVLGISLFLGYFRKLSSVLMILCLLVYTPLTGWLYATDAVADCGCFGDFIHLSNAQTFWKNVLLLVLAIVVLLGWRRVKAIAPKRARRSLLLWSIIYALGVGCYCIYDEPLIDFRPFYVGQNIPTAMEWPEDPESQPEILDFDTSVLPDSCYTNDSYAVILVAPYLEMANRSHISVINDIFDSTQVHQIPFVCLTASSPTAIQDWRYHTGALYSYAFVDVTTLETMARTSPALLLLRQGTIVAKYGSRTLPSAASLMQTIVTSKAEAPSSVAPKNLLARSWRTLLILLVSYLIPCFFLLLSKRKRSNP